MKISEFHEKLKRCTKLWLNASQIGQYLKKKEEMHFVKVINKTVFWIKMTPIALVINDLSLLYEFFNQGVAKRVWCEKWLYPRSQTYCFKSSRLLKLMEGACLIRQERKWIVCVQEGIERGIEIAHTLNVIHTHLVDNAQILLSALFAQDYIRERRYRERWREVWLSIKTKLESRK